MKLFKSCHKNPVKPLFLPVPDPITVQIRHHSLNQTKIKPGPFYGHKKKLYPVDGIEFHIAVIV